MLFGCSLLMLVGFPLACSDHFTYFPKSDGDWTYPQDPAAATDEITLLSKDGFPIVCWRLSVPEPRATILYFHGNTGNIARRVGRLNGYRSLNADVFAVDYAGFGKSGGKPSEQGCLSAADAAYEALIASGVAPESILVMGESLGGGVAVYLASTRKIGALCVQSSFTSIPDVARARIPYLPFHYFMRSRMDSLSRMDKIDVPTLFIGGHRDEAIPFSQLEALYAAAPDPKRLLEFPDCGHNDVWTNHQAEYLAAMDQLIDQMGSTGA